MNVQRVPQKFGDERQDRRHAIMPWLIPVLLGVTSQVSAVSPLHARVDPRDPQAWIVEFGGESARTIKLECWEDGVPAERHVVTLPPGPRPVTTLRGLKAATTYQCQAYDLQNHSAVSALATFATAALPIDLRPPVISVPSTNLPATGYTLYNYGIYRNGFKNNYLVIMDAEGSIRWYLAGPGAGDVDASYLGDDRILYGGMSASYYPPTLVGLDKVTQWTGTTAPVSPNEGVGQTNHDAGLSADGQSVFHLNYSVMNGYYQIFIVKQIDLATNQVIWSWDSELDGYLAGELPGGGSSSDLYHANSIDDRWENGRHYLYVGMRNLHRILKIDYLTKEVVWQLGVGGDFTLLEANGSPASSNARWFFQQHDFKFFAPGRASIYDNGTARTAYGSANYSRALQLELDEANMTARIIFEYREDLWAEPYWGGYDVLDSGNSLVAMGHFAPNGDGHNSALVELNPAGQVVWRADFRTSKDAIYRAERIGGCDIFNNVRYCPARALP